MKSLVTVNAAATKEVAQCCAKNSTVVVGCHD